MKADFENPLTLEAYNRLSAGERRAYDRAFALLMIEYLRGKEAADAVRERQLDHDDLLREATGIGDPGVAHTILLKIYASESEKQNPDAEPLFC